MFQLGYDVSPQEDTSLADMLSYDLESYIDAIQEISSMATKEFSLEKVWFCVGLVLHVCHQ